MACGIGHEFGDDQIDPPATNSPVPSEEIIAGLERQLEVTVTGARMHGGRLQSPAVCAWLASAGYALRGNTLMLGR
jgi:hypothetical protein